MADRTCPKCKVVFKFPSMLKIHVKNSFHCLTNSEDIEKYITENTILFALIPRTTLTTYH